MTEPLYQYTRGIGWQLTNNEFRVFERDGKRYKVWFERRKPVPGEYGWNIGGVYDETDEGVFAYLDEKAWNYTHNSNRFGWFVSRSGANVGRYTVTVFTEEV